MQSGVRHSSEAAVPAPEWATHCEPLVLGYHGSLVPDPEFSGSTSSEEDAPDCVPQFLLESWMEAAQHELTLRLTAEPAAYALESTEASGWTDLLQKRLAGILAQILGDDPDATAERLEEHFPVLPGLIRSAIAEWVDAIAVFHRRLQCDASRLAAWLGYSTLPSLASLTPAQSDLHDGAHMVLRLLFRNGRSVYYKPRPVTGEWLWDHMVRAVNANSSLQLHSAEALAGSHGQYGWVTSLQRCEHLPTWNKDSIEASHYWRAAGAMLCLAEHARLTDLHMGNVMATCGGPAVLDAETLATPPERFDVSNRWCTHLPIAEVIKDILSTGLLPGAGSASSPDTSGLFGRATAVPQIRIPCWSTHPVRGCQLQMVPAALVDHGNTPPSTSPLEALPLLLEGYREAAHALMRCRETLVAPRTAWRWTLESQHAPRIILRNTLSYGILLSRSLQATSLRSTPFRMARLRSALREPGRRAVPKAILRTETKALQRLLIPRFTALPRTRTLASNSGHALAPRYLSCSPEEAVLRKIRALTPHQLNEVQVPGLLSAIFQPA